MKLTSRISAIVALACSASVMPAAVQAAPLDLGAAGPAFWTVLQISDAKIDMSNPQGLVAGNVGVAAGGQFQSSGPSVDGELILGNGATWQTSGDAVVTGGVSQNDLLLSQAIADALFWSSFYDGLAATTSVSGGLITDWTNGNRRNRTIQ